MYLEKILAAAADQVKLAVVHVPQYVRSTEKGNPVRVTAYDRLGHEAMQAHLTGLHGMHPGHLGDAFAHPASLASWHGSDHVARPHLLHAHEPVHSEHLAEHPASTAEHAAGGHGAGGHLPGAHLLGHATSGAAPAAVHRETRRTVDRQTRRRLYRLRSRQAFNARHMKKGSAPGAGGAGSAGSSGGGSGSGSGGGSGSGSGSSQ